LLELKEAVHKLPAGTGFSLVVATIIAGIVGYASIFFLLRYLRTHSTGVFIGYRLIVGTLILILLFGHFIQPSDNAKAASVQSASSSQHTALVRADFTAPPVR
jgi:hypothetical protein